MPHFLQRHQRGFTFVELLLVMTLMLVVLAFSAPMVQGVRAHLAVRQSLITFHQRLSETLSASLAGKSLAALKAASLTDVQYLPDAYGLWVVPTDSGSFDTYYTEYQRIGDQWQSLYSIQQPILNEAVHVALSSDVLLFFERPYGRVHIYNLPFIPNAPLSASIDSGVSLDSIVFDFQYRDQVSTLRQLEFTTDKLITQL